MPRDCSMRSAATCESEKSIHVSDAPALSLAKPWRAPSRLAAAAATLVRRKLRRVTGGRVKGMGDEVNALRPRRLALCSRSLRGRWLGGEPQHHKVEHAEHRDTDY